MKDAIRRLNETLVLKRRKAARSRIYRSLTQYRLSSLLIFVTLVAVLCVVGPPFYQRISSNLTHSLRPYRFREEARRRIIPHRPAATEYRNEELYLIDDHYVFRGDCLIGGQWHRYWINDGATAPYIMVPMDE